MMNKNKAGGADSEGRSKRGRGFFVKLLAGVALLATGGGGAFALVQAGMIPAGGTAHESNQPQLVRKGEEDPYAPASPANAALDVEGEGGSAYRTSYYSFAQEFTSNLKHSNALLQVSLAASTRRDGRVLIWLRKHELAIRSALLAVMADTPEEEVYTLEGKQHLQKRLTGAINDVLTRTEGFGGVDAVYFRALIIQ